jgi:hypothetical protein
MCGTFKYTPNYCGRFIPPEKNASGSATGRLVDMSRFLRAWPLML